MATALITGFVVYRVTKKAAAAQPAEALAWDDRELSGKTSSL